MSSTSETRIVGTANTAPEAARIPHLGGLDGLRALAVIAVVLFHTELGWFSGGFLGVDVFFVISGYLITSLLLAEWRQTKGTDVVAFWLRRARRLLPAVYLAITAVVTFSVMFLPKEVASLRSDAVASFGYVTNWYLIFSQQSYFQAVVRPSMLRHLWSLAVEEQFYLVWPLLFVVGMRLLTPRRLYFLTLAGAAASASLMAVLYQPNVDPSRVYYGTDTRAFPLLLGAALAFVWVPGNMPRLRGPGAARLLDGAGVACLGVLVACFIWLDSYSGVLYRGGFIMVALVTSILIAASVHPASRLGVAYLSWRPLQWIGQRSYGIYIWHWPIFDLTRPYLDLPFDGVTILLLRLPLTLLLAELSYRFVETPFRKGALGRAWGALRASTGVQRRALSLGWAVAALVLAVPATLIATSVAAAQPPPPPSYLSVGGINTVDSAINPGAGNDASPTATPTVSPEEPEVRPPARSTPSPTTVATATFTAVPASTASPGLAATATPEIDLTPTRSPTRPPAVTPTATPTLTPTRAPAVTPTAAARRVLAIGDSVMLGAASQLQAAIPDVAIDAVQGRQSWTAADLLSTYLAAGRIGQVVVIHLGNNYTFTPQQVDDIMGVLGGVRRVILVNVKVPREWESATNAALANAPKKYANAALVDWRAASVSHPEYFWDDGMHLRPEGASAYARLIAAAIPSVGGGVSPSVAPAPGTKTDPQ